MKSFEQQTVDAIRNLTVAVVVLGVAVLCVCGLATGGLLSARSDSTSIAQQQKELKASVQSPNHVRDVLVWCDAINADRSYNRTFVQRVTRGHVAYTLAPLPCQQIASKTAASTKTKH